MKFPFAFVQRETRRGGPSYLTTPDNQFQELLPLRYAPQQSPDPIRASDFYANGDKIHPWSQQRVTSHLGLGSWANWEDVTFHIGKLIAYYRPPTYAGAQLPSTIRANIQPANPTTYGSLFEVPGPVVSAAGPAYSSSGFSGSGIDGYPY